MSPEAPGGLAPGGGTRAPVDAPAAAVGPRFAGLEGYRGLAALAVVVFHVYQSNRTGPEGRYPYAGTLADTALGQFDAFVDLFFVLSAFLLALPYLRSALAGQDAPNARAFLARRAARVVPLYFIAVTTVWAFRNPVLPGDWVDLLKHLTFTHVYDEQRIFYTIGPAWSLAVEVQFYVLLAVLGWLACRACRRLSPRGRAWLLAGGIAALGLASMLWKLVAWYVLDRAETEWPVWFGLPARLDVFAVGMGLALVVASGRGRWSRSGSVLLRVLALLVLVLGFATRPQGAGQDVYFHLIVAVGFGLLLAADVLGEQDRWGRLLSGRVLSLLGLISYSLYLWHEPLILLLDDLGLVPDPSSPLAFPVGVLVLVPLSLLVAWISYWLIEYPASALGSLVRRDGTARQYYAED